MTPEEREVWNSAKAVVANKRAELIKRIIANKRGDKKAHKAAFGRYYGNPRMTVNALQQIIDDAGIPELPARRVTNRLPVPRDPYTAYNSVYTGATGGGEGGGETVDNEDGDQDDVLETPTCNYEAWAEEDRQRAAAKGERVRQAGGK